MQKKKSHKKINNKTFNIPTKKQQESKIPVKNIMKEIGQLKKQLVSIKSKKYLQIQQNYNRNVPMEQKINRSQPQQQNKIIKNNQLQQKTKQNWQCNSCQCNSAMKKSINKKIEPQYIQPLRSQLFPITAPKSREAKLKLQIQQNKIKSLLQKLLLQSPSLRQTLKLLTSQLNFTMTFINSLIKQLQTQLSHTKQQHKQFRTDLSQLSEKIIHVSQKYSNQKHLTSGQMEQIAQLKRQLSYYICLMKDNKDEAEKYSKQYQDLQIYVKQLQQNNQLLRKQLKISQQKRQEYLWRVKDNDQKLQNLSKQFAIIQQDLHLSNIECQKQKQKRKQQQKLSQKQQQQKRQLSYKLNQRQHQIKKQQTILRQLNQTITNLQKMQTQYTSVLAQKKIQIQKLQRQNTTITVNLNQKQQRLAQQQEQLLQIKHKLDMELKVNKKLNQSLEYCQMQIDGLSQQIDQLRKANQRYKNQHFRNKLIHGQGSNEQSDVVKKTDRKQEKPRDNLLNTHSKNRKRMLGQIQQLIQKHRKSSDSQQQSQG